MRFKKLVWVVLGIAALVVIVVVALPFLVGDDLAFLRTEKIAYIFRLAPDEEKQSAGEASTAGQAASRTALAKRAVVTRNYVLIGDSRTKGLDQATGISGTEQFTVIAEVGIGYYWMMETALPQASATGITDYVLLLGVNDLENADRYLAAYRDLADRGIRLTLATVGPVEEGRGGYTVTNYEIDRFNARLSEVEGATVIDLNAYLWKNDFETLDGVHYTDGTYRLMEEFLLTELE